MKAYKVYCEGADSPAIIVWSVSRNKARQIALNNEWFTDCEYLDMNATRQEWADKLQSLSEWEFLKQQLMHGWDYYLEWDDQETYIDKSDLKNMKRYSSLDEMFKAYYGGSFTPNCEVE